MKRTRYALAVSAVLAIASAVLAPAASAASGPLAGTWTSIDTDGSNQSLTIVGSGAHVYAMSYFDDVASSACGGDPAKVNGPGYPDGDNLTMVGTLTCLPGGNVFRERLVLGYTYDAETDTLVDDADTVWHRTS